MNNKIIIIVCVFIIIVVVTSYMRPNPREVYSIQPTLTFPPIRLFENLLSDEECQQVIDYGKSRMQKSVVGSGPSSGYDKAVRTSTTAWIKPDEIPCLKRLSLYVEKITGLSHKNQEEWQLLRYKPGQKYLQHYDANHPDNEFYDATIEANHKNGWGERVYTFFIYLNDDFTGGTTRFTKLDLDFKPKKGCAILWKNLDKNNKCHELSEHSGMPVKHGVKWAINVWVRERPHNNKYYE